MTDEELIARLRESQSYEWQDPIWETRLAAADRIEALTEQLEAARADAKEAEAYAEELAKDQVDLCRQLIAAEDRLAKAVEVLTRLLATAHADDHDGWQDALKDARTLLAEIEGEKT